MQLIGNWYVTRNVAYHVRSLLISTIKSLILTPIIITDNSVPSLLNCDKHESYKIFLGLCDGYVPL